jgi:hypothetical protein
MVKGLPSMKIKQQRLCHPSLFHPKDKRLMPRLKDISTGHSCAILVSLAMKCAL